MQEYQCERCGAIYTIDTGNIPPAMSCMCKSTAFKVAKPSIMLEAN